jgi:hypothetical protein
VGVLQIKKNGNKHKKERDVSIYLSVQGHNSDVKLRPAPSNGFLQGIRQ